MPMIDRCYRETAARLMRLIRQYPHANLTVGSRAALAFCEVLQALTVLGARAPVQTAALITLPYRIRSESLIDNEKIIREITASLDGDECGLERNVPGRPRPLSNKIRILRELDSLQDVIHAMPYEIDVLDPQWFKVVQETLFRPEAPALFSQTRGENRKADFSAFRELLDELRRDGLIMPGSGTVKLTRLGSVVKYRNVFNYVEKTHRHVFKKSTPSPVSDNRKYRRGDSYKDLHVRRTLRNLVTANKNAVQVSKEDLRVKRMSVSRRCLVALALDHSHSMARSRKLQYAKDSAAGLIFAVKNNQDQFALIAFSDNAALLSPPGRRYERLIEQTTQLRPEGETNIADALLKARGVFSKAGGDLVKHAIIITDGVPTSESPDATRRELENRIFHELRKMRNMGMTVSVVCIRDELEESDTALARMIASMGRGSFSLVNTRDLLDQVLRDYSGVKTQEM